MFTGERREFVDFKSPLSIFVTMSAHALSQTAISSFSMTSSRRQLSVGRMWQCLEVGSSLPPNIADAEERFMS